MSKTRWITRFSYFARHKDIASEIFGEIPVPYFSVKGGAKRLIDVRSTNNFSLASEFEQARSFKNITLYLSQGKGLEWLDLMEVSFHQLPVQLTFFILENQQPLHGLALTGQNAKIIETPIKMTVGGKLPMVLKVAMSLPDAQLSLSYFHGPLSKPEFVQEEW